MCSPAVNYLAHGQYREALAAAAVAASANDSPASALNLRGVAEMMTGSVEKALSSFNRALVLEPSLSVARLNRGISLLRLNRTGEAAADFERVFSDSAALRPAAAFEHALADEQKGSPETALKWLDRALDSDAGFDDAIFYRGVIKEKLGDFQQAGRDYQTYLRLHPDSAAAMLRFGVAAQRSGHSETARRYLQQVLDAAPLSPEAVEARKYLVMWD